MKNLKAKHSYQDQIIALTTKHNKQSVIQPQILKYLEAELIIPNIDTDSFGTFTGEFERKGTPLEVAKKKALLGMKETGLLYGLASEGSFGAHPFIPFIASNQEILIFIDNKNGISIHETIVSEKTNYAYIVISHFEELTAFLNKVLFPSHALMVRPNEWTDKLVVFKGITNLTDLEYAYQKSLDKSKDRKVYIQTDMRANFNPTRMSVISEVSERLAKRITCLCPVCSAPGWGVIDIIRGLPCEVCGTATELIAYELQGCTLCKTTKKTPRNDELLKASPMYCGYCNP